MWEKIGYVLGWVITTAALTVAVLFAIDYKPTPKYINPELLKEPYMGHVQHPSPKYDAIIRLYKKDKFSCTGFVIDDRYALTAAHCIVDKRLKLDNRKIPIFDRMDKNTGIIAISAGVRNRLDTGIIAGDFRDFAKMSIYTDSFKLSDLKVMACGFPFGRKKVMCQQFQWNGHHYFRLSARGFLYPGMSGGPVIDKSGYVIGINSAVSRGGVVFATLVGILAQFGIEEE